MTSQKDTLTYYIVLLLIHEHAGQQDTTFSVVPAVQCLCLCVPATRRNHHSVAVPTLMLALPPSAVPLHRPMLDLVPGSVDRRLTTFSVLDPTLSLDPTRYIGGDDFPENMLTLFPCPVGTSTAATSVDSGFPSAGRRTDRIPMPVSKLTSVVVATV